MVKSENHSYKNFIIHHFSKKKRNINPEIIDYILDISHLHTYYVQAISNILYSQKKLPKSISEFELIYKEFILEKQILIKDNGALRLYDVFLEHYLRYIL